MQHLLKAFPGPTRAGVFTPQFLHKLLVSMNYLMATLNVGLRGETSTTLTGQFDSRTLRPPRCTLPWHTSFYVENRLMWICHYDNLIVSLAPMRTTLIPEHPGYAEENCIQPPRPLPYPNGLQPLAVVLK